jgi:hypothetical protein
MPESMTYIMQRNDRFYVVAYDGLDSLTGKERRRWHLVGHDRDEAESVAARIDRDRAGAALNLTTASWGVAPGASPPSIALALLCSMHNARNRVRAAPLGAPPLPIPLPSPCLGREARWQSESPRHRRERQRRRDQAGDPNHRGTDVYARHHPATHRQSAHRTPPAWIEKAL